MFRHTSITNWWLFILLHPHNTIDYKSHCLKNKILWSILPLYIIIIITVFITFVTAAIWGWFPASNCLSRSQLCWYVRIDSHFLFASSLPPCSPLFDFPWGQLVKDLNSVLTCPNQPRQNGGLGHFLV
jgi:hypothetical protein